MFSQPGTLGWFAIHEFRLAWRDFMRMMSAGKVGRERRIIGVICLTTVIMHVIAYLLFQSGIIGTTTPDRAFYLTLTGTLFLTFSLMMSQAMELVTRTFYSRSDLDLILSSPVSEGKIFAVRIGAIATATSLLSLLVFASVINVLALFSNPAWLAAYLVIGGLGALATALSLIIVLAMFKTLGAKRTRLISQIVAAVVGAGFIIGIQIAAIASLNSISRLALFQSEFMQNLAPEMGHWAWIPANAAMGDLASLAIFLITTLGLLGLTVIGFASKFGHYVMAAAGVSQSNRGNQKSMVDFRKRSIRASLRYKEWKLLLRDHWLLSQTLMQILYLAPPAFMLWQGFG